MYFVDALYNYSVVHGTIGRFELLQADGVKY